MAGNLCEDCGEDLAALQGSYHYHGRQLCHECAIEAGWYEDESIDAEAKNRCHNCSTVNPPEAEACLGCEAILIPGQEYCVSCSEPLVDGEGSHCADCARGRERLWGDDDEF